MSSPLLNPDERRRLVGVLGMLGSDAVGERAAAGLLATRILKAAGTTWEDLLQAPPDVQPRPAHEYQEQSNRDAAMATCRQFAGHLTSWECAFIDGIARRSILTPKQMATLAGLAAELPRRAM